jgi:glycosyltransferase involved in cell wall biosynthesis/peptidoglycan/xylan/chitin deacetylase (PgdA/CDA1 family)/SAM-dependent methyltransferase
MNGDSVPDEAGSGSVPTVSVVIPCYNLGAYVNEAVQSVLDQTYQDFEILLIDDGSTDPITRHLFASYRRPRTRILRTENQGLARTRNLGIREAAGRYVSFLDADDLLEPTFLERTVAVLESEPSLAFASCWLEGFGQSQFLWTPSTCDFPHLLAEDTVCTAALTRKDALVSVGGFDAAMPLPGYEDWDLAIGLVERGLRGRIVPEVLFRYRIRPGSMTGSCTAPENHARLLRYIVEKHPEAYEQHLAGVLEVIEARTIEIESRRSLSPAGHPDDERHAALLEETLHRVLESHSWKASGALREASRRVKLWRRRRGAPAPRISAVLTCRDQGKDLPEAFRSLSLQISRDDEVVIVDNGSKDPVTLQVLDGYRSAGISVVRTERVSDAAARELGLRIARAPYLFTMGSDQTLEADCLPRATEILDGDPSVDFVCCGVRDSDGTGFTYFPDSAELPAVLGCRRLCFPVLRRKALVAVGGYDAEMPTEKHADWDVVIRLAARGHRGAVLPGPLVNSHFRRSGPQTEEPPRLVRRLYEKHDSLFERHFREAVLGLENQRRALQAFAIDPPPAAAVEPPQTAIDWGELRRLEPVSATWGIDRGLPVDRYYIASFLERRREDIRGHVLEVKDATYTGTYGSSVNALDIVDIAADNPAANVIADLSEEGSLPPDRYDCFVLTQTIHIIYGVREVLQNAFRALKPGGVLLATLPCVSRLDYESGLEGDFWRFTPASARRLFGDVFGTGQVEVEAHGNVLACCGFLLGLAAEEFRREELDHNDPYFPLLLCIRAVKPDAAEIRSRAHRTGADAKAAILLYHRIDRSARDRWGLCVSPENFAAQLERLAHRFRPLPLQALAGSVTDGRVRQGSIALTFDDGYRDNLTQALGLLKGRGIPATFFLSGDGAAAGETFWWEQLDASLEKMGVAGDAAGELHWRLAHASEEDRRRQLDELPRGDGPFPPRMTGAEAATLAGEPLAEIGAHGWSHRALVPLSPEEQRREIGENIRTLSESLGVEIVSFAYPFGGPLTAETGEVLRELGIDAACAIGTEPVTARSDRLALPRLEVGDWSGEELEARLNSLLES